MNLVITRHVGLGVAGALAGGARDVAGAGGYIAAAGWRSPLAAPVRRPTRALVDAAERRGAIYESQVLAQVRRTSEDWLGRAVESPRVDHLVRALLEARILERVVTAMLDGEALERTLEIASERRIGIRTADAVLTGEGVDRLVAHVLDQPAIELLVERVLESRFAHTATQQVISSDEVQWAVGQIARSEEVRDALQSQTQGLVEEVGDQVRDRSVTADDRIEGVARRLFRRHPREAPFAGFEEGHASA